MTTPPDASPSVAHPSGDQRWMRAALALGRRGWGRTAPNPTVGCVIVGPRSVGAPAVLLAAGWTQPGGRPHAEAMALAEARKAGIGPAVLRDATAYVTLEPCAHHGRTPPCAAALIQDGIGRVVTALEDPDPRVAGRGHDALRAAGVSLTTGVCAAEAEADLAGHLLRQRCGRPHVTLKLAMSFDGRIALASGESQWISGPEARARAHLLRAQSDAIMVGVGTALADNPRLDVRLPGLADRTPIALVLDSGLRLPSDGSLAERAGVRPLWVLHGPYAAEKERARLKACGATPIETPLDKGGGLDMAQALGALGALGVTRVLCEGGGKVAASLLRAGAVDRLITVAAGIGIGGDGQPGLGALGLGALAEAARFERRRVATVGADVWIEWTPATS